MNPSIAIIEKNTLCAIALEEILSNIFPSVEVALFGSMNEFLSDCNRYFIRFFIGQSILLENAGEFDMLKQQTIVLCEGNGDAFANSGYMVLDITLGEKKLIAKIIEMLDADSINARSNQTGHDKVLLSGRENEVLTLIVKGYINKEIADKLNVSVTTVIFHRNNICNKLGTRSVGRLTLYALLNNLVQSSEL